MRRTAFAALCAITTLLHAPVGAAPDGNVFVPPLIGRRLPDVARLRDGESVERRLSRGDAHRYHLNVRAGELVRVAVDQRGIDVVVHTRGTGGAAMADFQDAIGGTGREQVDLVATESGIYTVVIEAAPGVVAPGSYAVRVVSRRAATNADRDLQKARILATEGARLYEVNRTEDAMPFFEEALTLTEHVLGPDDERVGVAAAQLAAVCLDLPDFDKAETMYTRAIRIMDRTLGSDHPMTVFTRSRLATLYERAGDRLKAEALIEPACEGIERTLGPDHLWFARCLGTMAALRNDAADLSGAEAILQREASIIERLEFTESLLYAGVLNNLGEVYGRRRDTSRAADFLQRAVTIGQRLRGPDDYFLSNPLMNLGVVARQQHDDVAAEAYYRRALAIRQRVVGPDHPELSIVLNNLANLYYSVGDPVRALEMHARALRLNEKTFGLYHRNTLLSVGNLARISAATGDVPGAVAYERRADEIVERQLALNLASGSERQKQLFVRTMSERTDRTISLHLRNAPDNPEAAALAALVLLQRKGRVQDAMTDLFAAARQHAAPSDRDLLDRFNETSARLAALALTAPPPGRWAERRQLVADLEAQQERIEASLSEHNAAFRSQMQPVTLGAVQAEIAEDAALVEYAVFRPFDPARDPNGGAYGAPHYAAYVIRRGGLPRGVDLGDAAAIDTAIDAFREALRRPVHDVDAAARALHDLVVAPLDASIAASSQLLISPDGNLNLVPFEALVDSRGRYLIERYATTYLTSGRDLLRRHSPRPASTAPLIVADPWFGDGERAVTRPSVPASADTPAGRSVTTGSDVSTLYFAQLSGTDAEARGIKALLPDAAVITGRLATKAAIQHVHAPRILHIASHGFFLDDGVSGEMADANPLVRSGLAFAGANLVRAGNTDGILTALEASGLDLWGTRLVTLSACDTGVGQIRNGEGVYGLRRAFTLAGTETLVMTLWAVSDRVTGDVMVAYYANLHAGLGRGEALRQAKLAVLKHTRHRHPYYWAGFIQSGEWTGLGDER